MDLEDGYFFLFDQDAEAWFRVVDFDGDGSLSREEVRHLRP